MERVIFDQGAQTIRHIPVDRRGRPRRVTSATYELVDLRPPGTDIASGSATLGAVDTVITATAGAGEEDSTLVAVTSATGITSGRTFFLVDVDGTAETFVVRAVNGLNVYATHGLRNDYSTSARVQDIELSASFPAPNADDTEELNRVGGGPFQITWDYDLDGRPYYVPELIYITNSSVQPFVTAPEVMIAYPTLGDIARHRITIEDAIAAATQDYVAEAECAGKDPTLYRVTSLAKIAVREKVIELVLRWCSQFDEADAHERQWRRYINQCFAGTPKSGAATVDAATNTATPAGDRRQQNRFVRRS